MSEKLPEKLDDAKSLAKFLGCSVAAIRKWCCTTNLPRIRIGGAIRFDRREVLDWFRNKQGSE